LLIIGLFSILTLVYTMRAFMRIWWQVPAEGITTKPTGDHLLAPSLLIGLIVLLGVWASPLVGVAEAAAEWIGNPMGYITAVLGG
jgi:formate hydrogenlyase subunit 3/multisubunit Na+/H+ antiporter MnhD subunit